MEEKAQVYISRHRIASDGDGIRTLLSFTGCNLDCKYCINRELRSTTSDGKWYSPEELLDEVLVDKYYFLFSGGGVTFSGGEPLLHAEFIREFAELASQHGINLCIETSLNVSEAAVLTVHQCISKWIIDIKDSRPEVYERYTGSSMDPVRRNISYLKSHEASVHFRVPVIPGYNTESEVDDTVNSYLINWAEEVEKYNYISCKSEIPETDGKKICRFLMSVRKALMNNLGQFSIQPQCDNTGNCSGTCPKCDQEMENISHSLDALSEEERNKTIATASEQIKEIFGNIFTDNRILNSRFSSHQIMGCPAGNYSPQPGGPFENYFDEELPF